MKNELVAALCGRSVCKLKLKKKSERESADASRCIYVDRSSDGKVNIREWILLLLRCCWKQEEYGKPWFLYVSLFPPPP